jgi:hypothetical protein
VRAVSVEWANRDHTLPPERLILTPPSGMRLDEREIGYRHAIAVAWRAIRSAQTADECRRKVVELGQSAAPDLSGPPRAERIGGQ